MKKYVYTVIGMRSDTDADRVLGIFKSTLGESVICEADIEKLQISLNIHPKRHLEEALRVILLDMGYELVLPIGAKRFAYEGEKKPCVKVPLWLTCTLVCVGVVLSALITFILTGGFI